MTQSSKLSPLQLELLKLYSMGHSDEDLLEIKKMLGRYFAKKLRLKVDTAVKEKGITQNDLDRWIDGK